MNLLADKTDYFVEGYCFATLEDAQQAQLEQKKAAYFESKLINRNAQSMLSVYDRILDEKVFITPAGWEYVKKLQDELRALGIEEEDIRPIPMYVAFTHGNDGETVVRQRIKTAKKKDAGKEKLKVSILLNIMFAILVAAMFAISLNSNNANILNYKSTIENKYAAWEQELTEREKLVRQKEAQLESDTKMESVADE